MEILKTDIYTTSGSDIDLNKINSEIEKLSDKFNRLFALDLLSADPNHPPFNIINTSIILKGVITVDNYETNKSDILTQFDNLNTRMIGRDDINDILEQIKKNNKDCLIFIFEGDAICPFNQHIQMPFVLDDDQVKLTFTFQDMTTYTINENKF